MSAWEGHEGRVQRVRSPRATSDLGSRRLLGRMVGSGAGAGWEVPFDRKRLLL